MRIFSRKKTNCIFYVNEIFWLEKLFVDFSVCFLVIDSKIPLCRLQRECLMRIFHARKPNVLFMCVFYTYVEKRDGLL